MVLRKTWSKFILNSSRSKLIWKFLKIKITLIITKARKQHFCGYSANKDEVILKMSDRPNHEGHKSQIL